MTQFSADAKNLLQHKAFLDMFFLHSCKENKPAPKTVCCSVVKSVTVTKYLFTLTHVVHIICQIL